MATKTERQAAAKARRAASAKAIKKAGSPAYYGAMGRARAKEYGGTKAPPKGATNVFIMQKPDDPEMGRVVRVGKRGGAYGQGGSPRTRWSKMSELGTIAAIVKA